MMANNSSNIRKTNNQPPLPSSHFTCTQKYQDVWRWK